MIRLSALWLVVISVAVFTWKDWFKGLCGLVVLIGILEYPDVPKSMFGVTGLNFFNLLLINVVLAWMIGRSRERLKWDLPAHIAVLLALYVGVILIGFYRMYSERGLMPDSSGSIISEYLVNTLKWIIPGFLLFDGCRSRERLRTAAFALLGAYVFLGLMVIKVMPIGSALLSGAELQRLALKLLVSRIGYHRVTLSMMLGGAAWAIFAAAPLMPDKRLRWAMPFVSIVMVYAQLLTGGRGGIVTLGIVGAILAALRWRKVFLVAPFVIVMLFIFVPSALDRLMEGFNRDPYSSEGTTVDAYELTAGRNLIWPYVIAQIERRPWLGWGRQAMMRTGTVSFLHVELNEDFGHPHNAYLETLLDNGVIGSIPVLALYLAFLFHAMRLFLEKRGILCATVGGIAASLVLALMVAGMSSQSFYPVEGTFEMWAAIGLMLRVSVERRAALKTVATENLQRGVAPFGVRPLVNDRAVDLDAYIFGDGQVRGHVAVPGPAAPRFSAAAARAAAATAVRASRAATPPPSTAVRFRF